MSEEYVEANEENLRHYYIELNTRLKNMSDIFGIPMGTLRKRLLKFGIKKTQKQAVSNSVSTHLEKDPDHFKKNVQRLQATITPEVYARAGKTSTENAKKRYAEKGMTYDAVFDLYITQNKSLVSCGEHFGISKSSFRRVLSVYGIVKDPAVAEKARKEGVSKLYSDPERVEEMVKKAQSTIKERYGNNWYRNCTSKEETEVLNFVRDFLPNREVKSGDYSVISRPGSGGAMELDIHIPELKLAIEYNGIRWHDRDAYLMDVSDGTEFSREALKDRLCGDLGIRLLHVWSDEWMKNRVVTEDAIKGFLNSVSV